MGDEQIKPSGYSQGAIVDLLSMILRSIEGLCTKLDADGGVPLTTYLANCYTAIFDVIVTDTKGNRTGLTGEYIISPDGLSDPALIRILYQILNSLETLTEQLDTDVLTDSNYEALCYTAKILYLVTDRAGNTLGNGTAYTFKPGGVTPQKELTELLYQIVDAWETLCEKLDLDGTVTDTTYESLWFTATFTMKITNGAGNTVGN
jgi:hypothetical protein